MNEIKALSVSCTYAPRRSHIADEVKPNANLFYKDPKISYTDYLIPEIKPNEVLIKVDRVGLCGSDYHCIETDQNGYVLFSGSARFPQILGHEFVGSIQETGSQVPFLKQGDFVACESVIWCGHCPNCRRGNFSECRNVQLIGLTCSGALKQYIVVPHQQVWRINQLVEQHGLNTALDLSTLLEPIGCAYKGIFLNGYNTSFVGATAAVYGAGPIGLSAAWLLMNSGVNKIFIFDKDEKRLDVARSIGLENCINPCKLESISENLYEQTDGYGIDISVECSGAAEKILPDIIKSAAARGMIIYLSRTWSDEYKIDFNSIVSKGNILIGSRGHAKTFPLLMKIFNDPKMTNIKKMITKRIDFNDVKDLLENRGYIGQTKVIVQM